MDQQPTPPHYVVLGSAAVLFVAMFLPWFTLDADYVSLSFSATDDPFFPTYAIPGLAATALGVLVAVRTFTGKGPAVVAGYSHGQLAVVAGVWGLLVCCSVLFAEVGAARDIGYWLSLLAGIGLVVGGVMLQKTEAPAAAAPPSTF